MLNALSAVLKLTPISSFSPWGYSERWVHDAMLNMVVGGFWKRDVAEGCIRRVFECETMDSAHLAHPQSPSLHIRALAPLAYSWSTIPLHRDPWLYDAIDLPFEVRSPVPVPKFEYCARWARLVARECQDRDCWWEEGGLGNDFADGGGRARGIWAWYWPSLMRFPSILSHLEWLPWFLGRTEYKGGLSNLSRWIG